MSTTPTIKSRALFYQKIKPLFVTFKQSQVDGINAILDEWERRGLTDLRWLAYMLATTYHETAKTMQPIEEYGKGKGHSYGVPDAINGHTYYGRGQVQITWLRNYKTMEVLLNVPLVDHPELALKIEISTNIMFEGMIRGLFTGKKLADYFNDKDNWIGARRIINGKDCAELIAGYGKLFLNALK